MALHTGAAGAVCDTDGGPAATGLDALTIERLRAVLGEDAFATASGEGRAHSLDAAVALALEQAALA